MQPSPLASDEWDKKHMVPLNAIEVGINRHLPIYGCPQLHNITDIAAPLPNSAALERKP